MQTLIYISLENIEQTFVFIVYYCKGCVDIQGVRTSKDEQYTCLDFFSRC